uniref:NADH dehydrogenase subunit 6 n=1 Tax=Daphnia laevis TaxID=42853 RepID=A0A5Q0RZS8_9CRUS|nr:NADH dehydrogenase subunit 6 [Daphnia laevis]QGA47439.1 NADH dehydrogenase subunit 6 [Daphnia laevis]
MQMMLLTFSTLMVFVFPSVNHPLLMGLIILLLTIMLAMTLGVMSMSTWLSYILIMILLGGLLVIFVYISLLAPNETQKPSSIFKTLTKMTTFILIISFMSSSLSLWVSKSKSFISNLYFNSENMEWMYLLYSSDLGGMTIFLVAYLFLTLIVVVFISKTESTSLRVN